MVLGSHICDMMRLLPGRPPVGLSRTSPRMGRRWAGGRFGRLPNPSARWPATRSRRFSAFAGAIHAYFGSKASDRTDRKRFGLWIYGSKGVIHLPNDVYPRGRPHILRSPGWLPDETHRWEPIEASPPPSSRFRAEGPTPWATPCWWPTCWRLSSRTASRSAASKMDAGPSR